MAILDDVALQQVCAPDGAAIGVYVSGQGPPLVLVHGTTSDHSTWDAVRPHLEPHATLYALDRRGRGASGDGPAYELAREFEDVAAVVDVAAAHTGSRVDLLGHSFGGLVAWGAVGLTANVRRIVLYEGWPAPDPAGVVMPASLRERLEALLDAGRPEAALETFYRELVQMSAEELAGYRSSAIWPARVAAAHTIPREDRACLTAAATLDPEQAATITVPVLLLVGEHSPDSLTAEPHTVAAALPDARVIVLDGQAHVAHHQAPERFAGTVRAFLRA